MRRFTGIFVLVLAFFPGALLFAQTHAAVPIDHEVYYVLEQAETRFLCSPLPAVKPYTRGRILEAISEILAAEPKRFGALSDSERRILENLREEFKKGEPGLDLLKGMYRFDAAGKKGIRFSGEAGVAFESLNSAAYYAGDKAYFGTDTWGTVFARGDVGGNFSFNVDFSGGLLKAGRVKLGTYDTFAPEMDMPPESGNINRRVDIYSQPLAFFPYSYEKGWDGFMFGLGEITASNMESWPEGVSLAPRMLAEMSGSVLGDSLFLRAGRLRREWGGMTTGSSLIFNAAARPFLGIEATFNPVSWFAFSSITGALEFDNADGIYEPAWSFQKAFSLNQVEFNIGNYFHIDLGSAAVWPKRFELGYIFPLLNNFLAQNLTGSFDNIAIHLDMKARYPGLGGIWFSAFVDEMEVSSISRAFELDRHMFAYQAGIQGVIPGISFASLTASYTRIAPYNYTHQRDFLPWYSGEEPMQKAYINNGVSLGHYLPPNSDEIKVRFDIFPWQRTKALWQYQLIRHGADYGPHQVDGSSLVSELDPGGRSEKASLKKEFLKDGAYQWMHIIKIGAEHTLDSLPLTVFCEAGIVYSYFTDISDAEYSQYAPAGGSERAPAEGEYHSSTGYILNLGVKIFK